MLLLAKRKDGGPDSPVDAYFLCEFKGLFSIALLKFNKGQRFAYHTHAFNAWTWFIKGSLVEEPYQERRLRYTRSLIPKFTSRYRNHRVIATRDSWCFTIRGPWQKTWTETEDDKVTTLTHGRQKVL